MNIIFDEPVSSYYFQVPGEHIGSRFVVGLQGADSDKTIASLSVSYSDPAAGRVEVSRTPIVGDRMILVDVPDVGSPASFYLVVFNWIQLPLTLKIWQHSSAISTIPDAESISFLPLGATVMAGDRTAVYTGDGSDFWLVGCRSSQVIENASMRFNCGSGRSVLGLSTDSFDEPRWWEIEHGWYVHSFEEIRAVDNREIPENARFSWSPLDELGILISGDNVHYQVKRNGEKSFQTLYKTNRKSLSPLRPAGVLGPQAFIYNCISSK